jgi:hypothetical protein
LNVGQHYGLISIAKESASCHGRFCQLWKEGFVYCNLKVMFSLQAACTHMFFGCEGGAEVTHDMTE